MEDDRPKTVTVTHLDEEVEVGRRLYVGNLPYRARWQGLKDYFGSCGEVVFADVKADKNGRSAGCGIVEFKTPEEAAEAMVKMHDSDFEGRKIFVRQDKEDRDLGGKGGSGRSFQPSKGGKGRGNGGYKGYNDYGADYSNDYNSGYNSSYGKGSGKRGGAYSGRGGKSGGGSYGAGGKGSAGGSKGGRENSACRCFVNNLAWETTWQDLKDHFRQVGDVVRADVFNNKAGRPSGNGIVEFSTPADAEKAIAELQESELHGRKIFVREDLPDHQRGNRDQY